MENFIFCTMKIPEFWHNKANYVFFSSQFTYHGKIQVKITSGFRVSTQIPWRPNS